MKKVVQKFGGTSLDTPEKRKAAVSHIKTALTKDYQVVVVVSAMGRRGMPYATDTLISLAEDICSEINPRERDLLMSCGEIISAVIMVQNLKKAGLSGTALTGAQAGIITDGKFGESEVISVKPGRINEILEKGKIPVIAGFQGETSDKEITTLGRGGSDTTAAVIAVALAADCVEIYTDVDGVMTADPDFVNDAKIISNVSYNEVCELAYQGARVIHPWATEIAMKESIAIKVKPISGNSEGTLIHNKALKGINSDKSVTGVTSRNNIVYIKIIPEKKTNYARALSIFSILAEAGISVDFINIRPDLLSFVVEYNKSKKAENLLIKHDFNYELINDFTKVSIVGGGMTGKPGVLARMVEALKDKDIKIYQTTDSHTTISCLIRKKHEKKALNSLHKVFKLEE